MVNEVYIASTLVMGLLVVGVVALVLRSRRWQQRPQAAFGQPDAGGGQPQSAVGRFVSTPSVWTLTFLVLALGLLVGATVAASGADAISGMGMIAGLGVVLVGYMVGGVYAVLRQHGRPKSQAVAASAIVFGALFLLAITVNLLLLG